MGQKKEHWILFFERMGSRMTRMAQRDTKINVWMTRVKELISMNSLVLLKGQSQTQYVGVIVARECRIMKASNANGKYLIKGCNVRIRHCSFFESEANSSS